MSSFIRHAGIIPDGNRRWARRVGMDYASAYSLAARRAGELAGWFFESGTSAVSIYWLSKDNLQRPPEELAGVFDAGAEFATSILPELLRRHGGRLILAGEPGRVPPEVEGRLVALARSTASQDRVRLYLLLGYDPIEEVAAAVAHAPGQPFSLERLWVPEPVDIVVRTGGGSTPLSNFLPLQCGYAQVHVLDQSFNDFTFEDFRQLVARAELEDFPRGE